MSEGNLLLRSNTVKDMKDVKGWQQEKPSELKKEFSALHIVCISGQEKTARVLISKNADVNALTKQEWSPLHFAAKSNSAAICKLLIKSDACVNAFTKDSKEHPLHLILKGVSAENPLDIPLINSILSKITKSNLNKPDKSGNTSLHLAIMNNHVEIVQLLIDSHHDINLPNRDGDTPLHLAVRGNNELVSRILLNSGACIASINNSNESPLSMCIDTNSPIFTLLKEHKHSLLSISNMEKDIPLTEMGSFVRHCFSSSQSGNNVFLFGGWKGKEASPKFQDGVFKMSMNDLSMERLTTKSEPASLSDACSVLFGDRLFVFGGITSLRKSNTQVWMLTLKNLTWKSVSVIRAPLAIYGQKTVIIQDSVYFFAAQKSSKWNEIHSLNLNTFEWTITKVATGPSVRLHYTINLVYSASMNKGHGWNSLIIFGGKQKSGSITNELWKFNIETLTWDVMKPTGNVPCPRYRHCSLLVGDLLYIHGGKNRFGAILSDFFVYNIEKNYWTECILDIPSIPRFGHTLLQETKEKFIVFGGCNTPRANQFVIKKKAKSSGTIKQVELLQITDKSPRKRKNSLDRLLDSRSILSVTSPDKEKIQSLPIMTSNIDTNIDSAQIISYVNLVQTYLNAPTADLKIRIGIKSTQLLEQFTTPVTTPNIPLKTRQRNNSQQQRVSSTHSVARKHYNTIPITKPDPDIGQFSNLKRFYAARELLSTEYDYLKDLAFLISFFLVPLRSELTKTNSDIPITEYHINSIFKNIEEIFQINYALYSELLDEIKKPEIEQRLGDVFNANFTDLLKEYKIYGANVTGADSTLSKLLVESQAFSTFVENSLKEPEGRGQTLDGFIIKPFQRMARYPFILKKIVASITEDCPEYEQLHRAIETLSNTAESATKVKKNTETIIEVVAIQNRFVISKPEDKELFNLHKHSLVYQGNLKEQDGRKSRKCIFFLFNDMIVIAKEKGTSLYRKHLLLLSDCTVKSISSKNNKYSFQINHSAAKADKKIVLICSSIDERDSWINRISHQKKISSTEQAKS